jgi:hypothetical protein
MRENKKYDSILDEAKDITGGERMQMYGHPRKNFSDIAAFWTTYLKNKGSNFSADGEIDSKDVAMMMALFKVARQQAGHKRDNLTDLVGYVRNYAQILDIE